MEYVTGRPRKFKTVKELEELIRNYFESCFRGEWKKVQITDKEGKPVEVDGKPMIDWKQELVQFRPFTFTGLAVFLDTTRRTLLDYESGQYDEEGEDGEKFSHSIKRAKAIIEQSLEENMINNPKPTGIIFNLKNNFGWRDRTEVDVTTKDQQLGSLPPG